MRIKSYFAPSVQEAIERARRELGPEAMLMSSKKSGVEPSRLGAYEVVFGVPNEGSSVPQSSSRPAANAPAGAPSEGLVRELADLRKQIETVRRSVSRQGYSRASGAQRSPELEEIYEWLIEVDFSEETAHELIQSVALRTPAPHQDFVRHLAIEQNLHTTKLLRETLREEIERRLTFAPELGQRDVEQRIVLFVGPAGAGKTSSLVKLAVKYGVAPRIPLQIFSTDTLRVGGADQLGTYARIIGAGFQAVPTIAALEQAIEECRTKKLILIDTPGFSPAEMEEGAELKAFLSRNPHVEVQLVLPVTLRASSFAPVLARFSTFRPSKILFTHLDDAGTAGAILDPAIRSGLPVSFLAAGQQIPEDIEEASKERLTAKLFERATAAAFAAA